MAPLKADIILRKINVPEDQRKLQMGEQLHRRLPQTFILEILEAFSQHQLSEVQACELWGLKRTRLYELDRNYLQACLKRGR